MYNVQKNLKIPNSFVFVTLVDVAETSLKAFTAATLKLT